MAAATMFAVSAGRRLAIVDPSTFKQTSAPPSPSKQTALDVEFTALTWSHDNSALFVACDGAIRRYDATGHFEKIAYSAQGRISCMTVKDSQVLIFAKENTAYMLNCETGEITATYEGHAYPITSLSLSRDCSLLVTASASECIVVDLGLAKQTALQGIAEDSTLSSICVFHHHSRTRLLFCNGRTIHVFDYTKPSAPAKTITLSSKVTGVIVAATCSPFSKSLAAVASSDGAVCLVDLEAEKGHFKSTDLKTPLTSLSFTTDGAALLAGTETGHLLMIDLRSFKDAPKRILISTEGKHVVGISVQRRIKKTTTASPQPTSSPSQNERVVSRTSPKPIKPLATQDPNVKSDAATRRVSAPTARPKPSVKSPTQVKAAKAGTLSRIPGTPARKVIGTKGISTPLAGRQKRTTSNTMTSSMTGAENAMDDDEAERMQALSTLVTKRKPATKPTVQAALSTLPKRSPAPSKGILNSEAISSGISPGIRRVRKVSTTVSKTSTSSVATKSSTATLRGQKESTSSKASNLTAAPPTSSEIDRKDRARLDIPNQPRTRTISNSTSVSAALAARRKPAKPINIELSRAGSSASRASSPDLDELSVMLPSPTTNLSEVLRAEAKKQYAKSKLREDVVSAASTPDEMDGWPISGAEPIQESRNERKVEFEFGYEDEEANGSKIEDIEDDEYDEGEKPETSMELQVSPRRPSANTSVQLTPLRGVGIRPTPMQNAYSSPYGPMPFPSTPSSAQKAQDFMRSLVSSAMYDFQQETRAELMGMHLDMLRMGREWKKELREVLAEVYGDEMKDLREENKKLREENERLRVRL